MEKRLMHKDMLLVFLVMLISTTMACWLETPKTTSKNIREETYTFDPQTVLSFLAEGRQDVFVLQDPDFDIHTLTSGEPVQWSQEDYGQIVDALFHYVWNEPADDWDLGRYDLKLLCTQVEKGPQSAFFTFYKIIRDESRKEIYWERLVIINPEKKFVFLHETEMIPNIWDKQPLDLKQLKISTELALQIAEKAGGAAVRATIADDCDISMILELGYKNKGWRVIYFDSSSDVIFEVDIDPRTGEYELNNPSSK